MAHLVDTMAYVGEVPWHGLGVSVPKDITPEEMVIKAGLNWDVVTENIKYGPSKEYSTGERRVMYRKDTGMLLDVIGPRYVPTQNHEVLAFFKEYVDAGDMAIETAGSLDHGKMVWALAKMGESFNLDGDVTNGYILLANPHQYMKAMVLKKTDIRVVCNNTLTASLRDEKESVKLWHRYSFDEQMRDEAKRRLDIARSAFHKDAEEAEMLANKRLTDGLAIKLIVDNVGNPDEDLNLELQPTVVGDIFSLYAETGKGRDLKAANDTAWGLLNAFTQYYDWEYGRNVNNRIRQSWFGKNEKMKQKVKQSLLNTLKVAA